MANASHANLPTESSAWISANQSAPATTPTQRLHFLQPAHAQHRPVTILVTCGRGTVTFDLISLLIPSCSGINARSYNRAASPLAGAAFLKREMASPVARHGCLVTLAVTPPSASQDAQRERERKRACTASC
ncbi:hypothetical protein DPX16_9360 [Anabarilius grahami]|uniref:Uncharacterized protein n=1 Tax=Anabarilius grahami TaxID=495550 RepID=A0A3N0Y6G7_ANAGA|nr:hypothetical protein DPX16_9360 [Anabarilius grahami]